jgi:dUTP pyrophosphatase
MEIEDQQGLTIKFKVLNGNVYVPKYQTDGAVGLDLQANENSTIWPRERALISTGLSVEIPEGYEGQVRPRSGIAVKHGVTVLNSPGTIDSDYRGELKVCLINHGSSAYQIKIGDRIAQLVICPVAKPAILQINELSGTERGTGGFGSTGT